MAVEAVGVGLTRHNVSTEPAVPEPNNCNTAVFILANVLILNVNKTCKLKEFLMNF